MAKIKVYELAKELNVSSKEVVEFLGEKNIEVKSHMSSLEEADAEIVRNSFGKSEKTEEKAAEVPKKKSIVQAVSYTHLDVYKRQHPLLQKTALVYVRYFTDGLLL